MDTVIVVLEDVPQFIELPLIKASIERANVKLAALLPIKLVVLCNSNVLLSLVQRVRIFLGCILHMRQQRPCVGRLRGGPRLFLALLGLELWLALIDEPQLALRHELFVLGVVNLPPLVPMIAVGANILELFRLDHRVLCLLALILSCRIC